MLPILTNLNMITSFSYLPHIIHPTRITEYTSTIIDNIYSNNLEDEIIRCNILIQFADHLAQFLSINRHINRTTPSPFFRRDFSNFKDQVFINDISTQDWNNISPLDTNTTFDNILSKIENCVDHHAPLKKLNRKQNRKISKINKYIIKMISHRNRLFKRKIPLRS